MTVCMTACVLTLLPVLCTENSQEEAFSDHILFHTQIWALHGTNINTACTHLLSEHTHIITI